VGVVVVLDACVLFPFTLRDTLLRIAEARLYQVRWTDEILEEVRRNLIKTNQATEDNALRLVRVMNEVFKSAPVTDYVPFIAAMTNDPKDRHVAAAAVACQADIILTFNLRHFPRASLSPFGIKAQSPDTFLCNLLAAYPKEIPQILQNQAQEYRKPPMTLDELLTILAKQVPRFVKLLRQHLDAPTP
jgi:predicted nucleic acid-binding protein